MRLIEQAKTICEQRIYLGEAKELYSIITSKWLHVSNPLYLPDNPVYIFSEYKKKHFYRERTMLLHYNFHVCVTLCGLNVIIVDIRFLVSSASRHVG